MTTMEMIRIFADTMGQTRGTYSGLYEDLITEEYKEWEELQTKYMDELQDLEGDARKELVNKIKEHELKELSDLIYVIYGYCYHQGWDIDEAVYRVHVNNIGRCLQPDGTIKRDHRGKIIKNKDYRKVDLRDLVNVTIRYGEVFRGDWKGFMDD